MARPDVATFTIQDNELPAAQVCDRIHAAQTRQESTVTMCVQKMLAPVMVSLRICFAWAEGDFVLLVGFRGNRAVLPGWREAQRTRRR
jgi:hypothetical protein